MNAAAPAPADAASWRDASWRTHRGCMDIEIDCPHCGEPVSLQIDETGGREQEYIEDCAVCCRPLEVSARFNGEEFDVRVRRGSGE